MEYYVWPMADLATAQAALAALNNDPRLPLVGVNAGTQQPDPTAQKTEKWAEGVETFVNDTVGFPCIPEALLDFMQVSPEDRAAWLAAFHPTIVEYDPAWMVQPEEAE